MSKSGLEESISNIIPESSGRGCQRELQVEAEDPEDVLLDRAPGDCCRRMLAGKESGMGGCSGSRLVSESSLNARRWHGSSAPKR